MKLTVAHSPDPDDAFMFYALTHGKIESKYELEETLSDIETLNKEAINGRYHISAISYHALPYIIDKYDLMSVGSSVGDKYGPILISKNPLSNLENKVIALPGELTTATLVFRIYSQDHKEVFVPFDQIMDKVINSEVDAGLLIHEGQLSYKNMGLKKIVDLGEWWYEKYNLPLPLGGNAIHKSLRNERIMINNLLRESIKWGKAHPEEALTHAMKFGRDLNSEMNEKFVNMYVNDYTIKFHESLYKSLNILYKVAFEKSLIPSIPDIPESILNE
ncbi:1,4-dihydroxy-6-naphthoate synthase [Thermodesulfobium acidiphilum]|uniref:1,4-dihydroxy-6-naphtoate synthase n=1 Tax=Thermodesulfobium acidiphilum TaxID=1794699 RepID=A0A2R4VYJ3_THEAF|nr:MqnA/MqnD/SBP family protein [Thermodesulfobium acidiphilum]AWB09631.1 1,4-dihydroxy-6-naphthoate synthase [Thermodesulfobium acidiphilum]PMP85549.1 MAG: ABC transporter substrate-binding protein [Thermodesulfobium narugense]